MLSRNRLQEKLAEALEQITHLAGVVQLPIHTEVCNSVGIMPLCNKERNKSEISLAYNHIDRQFREDSIQ